MLRSSKRLSISLVLTIVFSCFQSSVALAATATGTPSTLANDDANSGTVDWTYSNQSVLSSNDNTNYATASIPGDLDTTAKWLATTNYGFSIPSGSSINGVEVDIDRSSSVSSTLYGYGVKLIVNGSIQGNDKDDQSEWPTTETVATYGGSSDLWGLTPTVSQVNASNFGVAVSVNSIFAAADAKIDHIEITVHYSAAPVPTVTIDSTTAYSIVGCEHYSSNDPAASEVNWDSSVTNFDSSDLEVVDSVGDASSAATITNFSAVSGTRYTFDIDVDAGTTMPTVIGIKIPANAVDENNAEKTVYYRYDNQVRAICDQIIDANGSILWKLDETAGDSALDTLTNPSEDGSYPNEGVPQQCKASTETDNTYSAGFDGVNDYISYNETGGVYTTSSDIYVSLWARSDSSDPDHDTLFQMTDTTGDNLLTIAYRSDVTNYLSVTRTVTSDVEIVSDTAFTITDWVHIFVVVNGTTNLIDYVYVNGSDVAASGTASNAANGNSEDYIYVAAQNDGGTMKNYFDGLIDEVSISPSYSGNPALDSATVYGMKNTGCTALSTYNITNLPGTHAVRLVSDDTTNPVSTALASNTYAIRLKEGSVPVTDVNVDLTQDRNWSGIVADADTANSKAVADFDAGHGKSGAKTLYVQKNSHTSLRICPDAETLEDVSSDCNNGVLIADGGSASVTFPSGSSTVSVTSPEIGGTEYFMATGMLGSGGQGEGGGGGGEAPEFTWWALLMLTLACGYVLQKHPQFVSDLLGPKTH